MYLEAKRVLDDHLTTNLDIAKNAVHRLGGLSPVREPALSLWFVAHDVRRRNVRRAIVAKEPVAICRHSCPTPSLADTGITGERRRAPLTRAATADPQLDVARC